MKQMISSSDSISKNITRRRFLASTGAAAFSFTVMKPHPANAAQVNSKIKLGMLGCGGRGSWLGDLFQKHGGYELVACADYFQDRADAFGEKFNIPANRRFTNLSGYKKLLDSKIDAIAIESPPYFHPAQTAAAIDAGCHVYLAKPIAVDAPGCRSIAQSGKKATEKKLCLLVDFQTRANPLFIEAVKRVHAGAIGDFAFGESTYHAGSPWKRMEAVLAKDPSNSENRLRAWGLNKCLSGDIITEQNIHTLDVMSWIMDTEPISAVGTGGKKVRVDAGDCWDHFALLVQYPNNVGIAFSSRQFNGHDSQPDGIRNRMFGSKGVLETKYGGQVLIRGENFYKGGRTNQIYTTGAVSNIENFYKNITEGNCQNPTVEPSVRSNLVTIMARSAAYEKRIVTWTETIKNSEVLKADLSGLKI